MQVHAGEKMLRDWKGPYSKRLALKLSERGRRMAAVRWAKWRAEAHLRPEREPRLPRTTGLSWAVRDDTSGVVEWMELKSARDVFRRVTVLLRYYKPGFPR